MPDRWRFGQVERHAPVERVGPGHDLSEWHGPRSDYSVVAAGVDTGGHWDTPVESRAAPSPCSVYTGRRWRTSVEIRRNCLLSSGSGVRFPPGVPAFLEVNVGISRTCAASQPDLLWRPFGAQNVRVGRAKRAPVAAADHRQDRRCPWCAGRDDAPAPGKV